MKRLIAFAAALLLTAAISGADKKIIYPDAFPENLPFSPGVQVGDTLYCAGQTGSDLKTGEYPENFKKEVEQTFERIEMILHEAGYEFSDVVDVKVYLTDIATFPQMNKVFTSVFPKDRPARTTVQVASLVGKARVEITAVARK